MKILWLVWLCLVFIISGCNTPDQSLMNERGSTNDPLNDVNINTEDSEMVLIPAGTFLMGNNAGNEDEKPLHEVYTDAFYIDVTEVTCDRYNRFLKETNYPPHPLWNPKYDRPEDPVVGITWKDALAFANWAGKRLPTEAEWEKAARGGLVKKLYSWGNDFDPEKANCESFGSTPVKSYGPNEYGIYDMAGNIWEWCYDWYDKDYYSTSSKKNPKGPMFGTKKVIRGGAWCCNKQASQVANRYYQYSTSGNFQTGFRCVKSVK